jgi:L-fuconolactonase
MDTSANTQEIYPQIDAPRCLPRHAEEGVRMHIVDSHCHVSPYWYEPVEILLHHMDRNGVAKALLVQYAGQFDNDYQFQCIQKYPDRLASVVLVDHRIKDAPERLGRLAEKGAKGLRLRAHARSPGSDPLALWRAAEELCLPVSCGGAAEELLSEEFASLVESLPGLSIVIEHLGMGNVPQGEKHPFAVRRRVFELARFPNTRIKFHGLGEFCPRNTPMTNPFPFRGKVLPILDMALEAFGPDRMMWGSDWPPVSQREGYANALRFPLEHLGGLSEKDRDLMFGGVARSVYNLDG